MKRAIEVAEIRVGDFVRYEPDPSRHSPRWCREGTAVANEHGVLVDTYWGSGMDSHVVTAAEMDSVEVLFHVDDYDELDRYRPNVQHWETFAPADRQRITMQHGLQQRLFVRKGAEPDLATQIQNAEKRVRDAEHEVESAMRRLQWAHEDLDTLAAIDDAGSGGS